MSEAPCGVRRHRNSSTATLRVAGLPACPLTISSLSKPLARTQLAELDDHFHDQPRRE